MTYFTRVLQNIEAPKELLHVTFPISLLRAQLGHVVLAPSGYKPVHVCQATLFVVQLWPGSGEKKIPQFSALSSLFSALSNHLILQVISGLTEGTNSCLQRNCAKANLRTYITAFFFSPAPI